MSRARRLGVLGAALLLLTACDPVTVEVTSDPNKTTYSRDARTGLCFATLGRKSTNTNGHTSWGFSTTNVPCSPEVLALVPPNQR